MEIKIGKKEIIATIVISIIIVFLYLLPIWGTFSNSSQNLDFDLTFSRLYLNHITITEYQQFPFYNPYMCGGTVAYAHPHVTYFPFQWIPILFFGVVKGVKINIFLYLLLGTIGTYLLARYLKSKILPAAVAAAIFSFSGYFSYKIAANVAYPISIGLIPLIFLTLILALKNKYFLIPNILLFSWLFLEQTSYIFLYTLLLIGIYILWESISRKSWKPLIILGVIGIILSFIVAVKLLPLIDMYETIPRKLELKEVNGIPLKFALDMFLDKEHTKDTWDPNTYRLDSSLEVNSEFANYLGVLPLIFFILGFFILPKSKRKFAWIALFFLLIVLGIYSPIPLIYILHKIPGYASTRLGPRTVFLFNLLLGLVVAFTLTCLSKIKIKIGEKQRSFAPIVTVLSIFIIANLFFVNTQAFEKAFTLDPIDETFNKSSAFEQLGSKYGYPWNFYIFPNMRDNKGWNKCNFEGFKLDWKAVIPKEFVLIPENRVMNFQQRPILVHYGDKVDIAWLIQQEIMNYTQTLWKFNNKNANLQIVFADINNEIPYAVTLQDNYRLIYTSHTIKGISFSNNNKEYIFTKGNLENTSTISYSAKFQKQDNMLIGSIDNILFLVPWDKSLPFEEGNITFYKIGGSPWKIPNQNYRGEIYMDSPGNISTIFWSPNKRVYEISASREAEVTINQIFFPGWNVLIDGEKGLVYGKNNLTTFNIPPGSHKIKLTYRANGFVLGGIISLLTIILILILKKNKRILQLLDFLYEK